MSVWVTTVDAAAEQYSKDIGSVFETPDDCHCHPTDPVKSLANILGII